MTRKKFSVTLDTMEPSSKVLQSYLKRCGISMRRVHRLDNWSVFEYRATTREALVKMISKHWSDTDLEDYIEPREPRIVRLVIELTDVRNEAPGAIAEAVKTALENKAVTTHGTNLACPDVIAGRWTRCLGHVKQRFTIETISAKEVRVTV